MHQVKFRETEFPKTTTKKIKRSNAYQEDGSGEWLKMMDLIREILKDIVGVEEITSETEFVSDLNLNSFDVVNMVCALLRSALASRFPTATSAKSSRCRM